MNKRTLQLLSTTVLIPIVIGCKKPTETETSNVANRQAQVALKYPLATNLVTLDPSKVQDAPTHEVFRQIYESLVEYDESNQIKPSLAEKWDVSKDGRIYTFHLKRGVKFHNGKELVAEDVKWSFDRASDPKMGSPTVANFLGDVVGFKERMDGKAKEISGVKVIDPYTVQITIDKPTSTFIPKLGYTALSIVPKVESTVGEIKDPKNSIGTGPFRFTEYHPNQLIVLEAYDGYHLGKPSLPRIEISIVKDMSTALNEYKAGKYHFTEVSALDLLHLKKDSSYKDQIKEYPSATVSYLELNPKLYKPFANRDVRRAFAMAIDRAKIANETLAGNVHLAEGLIPKGVPGYRENVNSIKFDPQQAKELLAKAGYADPSKMPPVNLTVSYTVASQAIKPAFAAIAIQLRKNLGLKTSVSAMEWATLLSTLNRIGIPFRFAGWMADYIDPENFLTDLFATNAPLNHSRYSNPEFDKLCAEAGVSQDMATRLKLYGQAEDILVQDAAAIPLFFRKDFALVQDKVKGLRRNLLGFLPFNSVTIEK